MMARPGLSVGPLLYFWSRERTLAFYQSLVDAPVDAVYLGETVCAKRRALAPDDWIGIGRELAAAGKQIALSTLTLIEARSELGAVRRLCDNGEFLVEANDYSAVHHCASLGIPFVGGLALNVYNAETLAVLVRHGLERWLPPVELGRESLAALAEEWSALDQGRMPAMELFSLGRMPLAWSARCFTARAYGRPKDDCGLVCAEHPGGMSLETQDGECFLTLNGIQTQSGRPVNLFPHLQEMAGLDISLLRVSPMPGDMSALLRACRGALDGEAGSADRVASHLGEPGCDGYWDNRAGMAASM